MLKVRLQTTKVFYLKLKNRPNVNRQKQIKRQNNIYYMNIHFLVAADKNFRFYASNLIEKINDLDYPVIVYDLGGLEKGEKFDGRVSSIPHQTIPSKPNLILNALSKIPKDEFLVWLDADTLIFGNVEEIIGEYDIGVTVRKKKSKKIQEAWINAGVIFIKHTAASINFIESWKRLTKYRGGDQWALNEICNLDNSSLNELVERESTAIKKFPCEIYNNFYFNQDQSMAKILHYKANVRHNYPYK